MKNKQNIIAKLDLLKDNETIAKEDLNIFIESFKKMSNRVDVIIKVSDKQQHELITANGLLDKYKIELESKIREKTKELQSLNANLEDRVKQEVELNRSKDKKLHDQLKYVQLGELITNIAHQWRQPLSVISTALGGMQLQREYEMSSVEDEDRIIEAVLTTVNNLSNTIENLTTNNSETKQKEQFKPQKEIDKVLEILDLSLKDAKINIKKIYPSENIIIYSISNEFSKVILNILQNSIDAINNKKEEDKAKEIIIEVKMLNNIIHITIEDNGIGINKDLLPKIFDPYFTTKHQAQGVGLGLYNSKEIVNNILNGDIDVKNTECGAKFKITLPIS